MASEICTPLGTVTDRGRCHGSMKELYHWTVSDNSFSFCGGGAVGVCLFFSLLLPNNAITPVYLRAKLCSDLLSDYHQNRLPVKSWENKVGTHFGRNGILKPARSVHVDRLRTAVLYCTRGGKNRLSPTSISITHFLSNLHMF